MKLGPLSWRDFSFDADAAVLDGLFDGGKRAHDGRRGAEEAREVGLAPRRIIIQVMAERASDEFERLGMKFGASAPKGELRCQPAATPPF